MAATFVLAACVDNGENARQFCGAHRELIDEQRDDEALTADMAGDLRDDIEATMRDAEDATRPVRGSARDLVAAYDDLSRLLDDDDAPDDELETAAAELQQAREDVRIACADHRS